MHTMRKKETLWTPNYTRITLATVLGAIGNVAVRFALSFLVFDETGSTLAAGLLLAVQLIPTTALPLIIAPWLDRLPRKPFLVWGDAVNGLMYLAAGVYLVFNQFSYIGYLVFSLVLSCMNAFDSLAYTSLYPKLIPPGFSQKGYTVSQMVYPTITVVMTPLAGFLYEHWGIAFLCLLQAGLSLLAAAVESRIKIQEERSTKARAFSPAAWWRDLKEAFAYLRREKGLQSIYSYMAVTNGVAQGYSPILVAFFRTTPGLSVVMYSAFTVAEFLGRTLGGLLHYHVKIPEKRRFSLAFFVYMAYEGMDTVLLWLGYPLMLVNRGLCGFLGVNSAALREASVQNYIPDAMRAKLNAFFDVLCAAAAGVLSLGVGALGEVLDYRICLSLCGALAMVILLLTIWRNRRAVRDIYNREPGAQEPTPEEQAPETETEKSAMQFENVCPEREAAFRTFMTAYYREAEDADTPQEVLAEFIEKLLDLLRTGDISGALLQAGETTLGAVLWMVDQAGGPFSVQPGWGTILEFGVNPAYRKQGLGRQAAAYAEDRMREAGVQNFYVSAYGPAQGFWTHLGYAVSGELAPNGLPVLVKAGAAQPASALRP